MSDQHFWKISDFIEVLHDNLEENQSLHSNTVDGWFKRLEKERIHYINRTIETNEKIYDELDLKIALFIKKRREEKWSISSILRDLPNFFELRPFPIIKENTAHTPSIDNIEIIKKQITEEVRKTYQEIAAANLDVLRKQYEELLNHIPSLPSPLEQKEQRFQEFVIRRRVENKLVEEAIKQWESLPASSRMKKKILFRKEIDLDKKNTFIRKYVNEHFETRLRQDMGLI
ncbi:MerR family transcriptional regulator [Heyndrickxia ginsengihumi]|uniref:MerR family transcriptional regulator n=1 Tax=Heyndrickxia ginsengihumi TaxID=363870 RepID=UPI003D203508